MLARELAAARVPIIAVLGNHDHESGQHNEVSDILCEAGVNILDGETFETTASASRAQRASAAASVAALWPRGGKRHQGVRAGGDGRSDQARKGGRQAQDAEKVVLLHYSPIQATVEGEPPEIFPFLGSSRLEEPLLRYPVSAVFHGHAHNGAFEGRTRGDVPVFNVGVPVLRRDFPNKSPYLSPGASGRRLTHASRNEVRAGNSTCPTRTNYI